MNSSSTTTWCVKTSAPRPAARALAATRHPPPAAVPKKSAAARKARTHAAPRVWSWPPKPSRPCCWSGATRARSGPRYSRRRSSAASPISAKGGMASAPLATCWKKRRRVGCWSLGAMKNQARMCTAAMVVRALQPRLHDLKAPVSAPMSAPAKAERHGTTSMRWRRHPICVLTTAKGRAHRAAAEGVVVRVQTAQTVETIAPRSATNTLRPSRPMLPLSAQPAAISASPWLLRRCRQSR